jgi:hypothetical protein
MTEPFSPKSDEPPLLYDLVMSGERVRDAGGPWLGEEKQTDSLLTAPAPPSLQSLWEGQGILAPQPSTSAQGAVQQPQHQQTATLAQDNPPSSVAEVPDQLRVEIERQAYRTLAKQFRKEISSRLDEALRQSHEPVRKAVEEALVNAVTKTRTNQ